MAPAAAPGTPDPNIWERLTGPMCRHATAVTVVTLGVLVLSGVGLRYVETSVQVRDLLAEDSRVLRDYRWLEANVGPLVSAEVIVNFAADSPYGPLERLALVRQIRHKVDQISGGRHSLSATLFLPEIPPPGGLRETLRRNTIKRIVEQEIPSFIDQHLIYQDAAKQSWRISTRVPGAGDVDYGLFLADLRRQIEPLLEPHASKGVSTLFTGLTPVVYAAQRAVLVGMFQSFLSAFLTVALAMIVVQRHVGVGLLAMIPNVLPSVVVFGWLGWLGIKVDVGTMITASVAIGIAVDDAIHFLAWYRHELNRGRSSHEAVRYAAHHCGWAMFQTSAVCSLGMLVFTLSGFVPTRRFAWMICSLLMLAVLGNLVLLPPLLVGPLGRLLRVERRGGRDDIDLPNDRADDVAGQQARA